MSNQKHECNLDLHTNTFLDLNGIPYLYAEYFDNRNLQPVDRTFIKSGIFIDQSESMRAIIDISIDDIGKRGSDGLPAIVGNKSKLKRLIGMISNIAEQFNHQLSVIRPGIIMRVNYQVEDQSNGQVIRTTSEDLRLNSKTFYLDVNPRDINDNAIIAHYNDTLVSTMSEFTSGNRKMVLRVTSIQMLYDCLKSGPDSNITYTKPTLNYLDYQPEGIPGSGSSYYQFHEQLQSQHSFGCDNSDRCIIPPSWKNFNRFYHVDHDGKDFILHNQEIFNPNTKSILIPCGTINVNRSFVINPGHRIIFKFSVWKNDITVVHNTQSIAQALNAQVFNHDCFHNHHGCNHHPNEDKDMEIIRLRKMVDKLIGFVYELTGVIKDLKKQLEDKNPDKDDNTSIPSIPSIPAIPNHNCNCDTEAIKQQITDLQAKLDELEDRNPDCDHSEIDSKITGIESEIDKIRDDIKNIDTGDVIINCGCGDENCNPIKIEPITEDDIEQMIQNIKNNL